MNDTNYCVDCVMQDLGVKVVVLGAELITKSFQQLFSLRLSSVFESSTETSSVLQ